MRLLAVQKMEAVSKKNTSNKSLNPLFFAQLDERNRTRPAVPAVRRTGRSAKLPGGLCVSIGAPGAPFSNDTTAAANWIVKR